MLSSTSSDQKRGLLLGERAEGEGALRRLAGDGDRGAGDRAHHVGHHGGSQADPPQDLSDGGALPTSRQLLSSSSSFSLLLVPPLRRLSYVFSASSLPVPFRRGGVGAGGAGGGGGGGSLRLEAGLEGGQMNRDQRKKQEFLLLLQFIIISQRIYCKN